MVPWLLSDLFICNSCLCLELWKCGSCFSCVCFSLSAHQCLSASTSQHEPRRLLCVCVCVCERARSINSTFAQRPIHFACLICTLFWFRFEPQLCTVNHRNINTKQESTQQHKNHSAAARPHWLGKLLPILSGKCSSWWDVCWIKQRLILPLAVG